MLGVLALSLLLRLWGIGDRLPDPELGINVFDDSAVEETDRTTMGRAWNMWRGGTKAFDLNPHTGGWPGLSFYVTLGTQLAYKACYSLGHPGATPAEFARHIAEESPGVFRFARVVGVALGVLTVWATIVLGTRIAGRGAGLLAGFLLASNPLHIQTSQHIADPNLLALLFVLLASLALLRIHDGGGARASVAAGAAVGFAGACKYVPMVLALLLLAAHWRGWFGRATAAPEGGHARPLKSAARTGLDARGLAAALGAMLAALFLASPFTFLDWKTTLHDMSIQRQSLFSDWVGQSAFPISLPTYLGVSLPHALGWPGYLLALVGMVLLWRAGPRGQLLVSVAAILVLANGVLKTAQERYALVALPAFAIGTAAAVLAARQRLGGRPWAPGAAAGLAALAILWPIPEYVSLRAALAKPDTRHLARRWINEHIEPERPMAVELYGPVFNTGGRIERAVVIWPFFATRAPLVRPAYNAAFLDGLEYIVLSSEVSRRFQADSVSYPRESSYYRWINANTRIVWTPDDARSTGPRIEVRSLPGVISTQTQRDSIFASLVPRPTGVVRLALWCSDFADLFGRAGETGRTIEWARRGLRVGVPDIEPRLWTALTFALLREGRFHEADSTARSGLARFPDQGPLLTYRGLALEEMGRLDDAIATFHKAAALTKDPRVRLDLGRALSAAGRYEEAITELSRVPVGHPDRGSARRNMGVVYLNNLHRVAEGVAALKEAAALERDPGQASLLRDEVARLEAQMRKRGVTNGAR